MKVFDDAADSLRNEIAGAIVLNSEVSVAAACFSLRAYDELKEQLDGVDRFRFMFSSPTFVRTAKTGSEPLPQRARERVLYGTEAETAVGGVLRRKAVARECAEWIRKKAAFKSVRQSANNGNDWHGPAMSSFLAVEQAEGQNAGPPAGRADGRRTVYMPLDAGFTPAGIGAAEGTALATIVNRLNTPTADAYLAAFDRIWNDPDALEDVTGVILNALSDAYAENPPELVYFIALYYVFGAFLEENSTKNERNGQDNGNGTADDSSATNASSGEEQHDGFHDSKIWNALYDFQKDAALALISKLERHNGCILADSVGLGKTFTALAVIKYYESRNKNVLVLCPKQLAENWNTYKSNYANNPLAEDRLRYDVLFHTDLSRTSGESNGLDLSRINWGNYDLVVIDESHAFRNGGDTGTTSSRRHNRYTRLLEDVVRAGVQTKVLMLSATPVNNRFDDLENQLALAYGGVPERIKSIFRRARKAFLAWSRLPEGKRTADALLRTLDPDFFDLLDAVTIARSRANIREYYDTTTIGTFPERLKPISLRPSLTDLPGAASDKDLCDGIEQLNLAIYTPSAFLLPGKGKKASPSVDREAGVRRLMGVNLLKRLESSVYSFRCTLQGIRRLIAGTLSTVDDYERRRARRHQTADEAGRGSNADKFNGTGFDPADFDENDQNTDYFAASRSSRVAFADMDLPTWSACLRHDQDTLDRLLDEISGIDQRHDAKLQELLGLIARKIENPINPGNRKILVFSAFASTAEYLYDAVSKFVKDRYGLNAGLVAGTSTVKTTAGGLAPTFNNVLTCFSPLSKDRSKLGMTDAPDIDVLIATDCICEGQNLQDCDCCVNYDIHWNPVRLIQRFGRVDRIGSCNKRIQLVNFWPDLGLDEYINLKDRVENRMAISVLASTGDDNPLSPDQKNDLEYRKRQLRQLQDKIVDLEDLDDGVSLPDLGLTAFRLDLGRSLATRPGLGRKPTGLYAVVRHEAGMPAGAIFVLKDRRQDSTRSDQRNDGRDEKGNGGSQDGSRRDGASPSTQQGGRLRPYHLVYMAADGTVARDDRNSKAVLEALRALCRGKAEPDQELCNEFDRGTDGGQDMSSVSALLDKAVASIGEESGKREGASDASTFELICFLVVK